MNIQEQVITLEQARRLQELGFDKESLFGWYCDYSGGRTIDYYTEDDGMMFGYTASELMDILPQELYVDEQKGDDDTMVYSLLVYKEDKYQVQYGNSDWEELFYQVRNENLAQALGDTLIYLLENDLLPIDKKDD